MYLLLGHDVRRPEKKIRFYDHFDRNFCDFCEEFRLLPSSLWVMPLACPGCLADATDVCQIEEACYASAKLTKRAWSQ